MLIREEAGVFAIWRLLELKLIRIEIVGHVECFLIKFGHDAVA
jgi:hypothetical protein